MDQSDLIIARLHELQVKVDEELKTFAEAIANERAELVQVQNIYPELNSNNGTCEPDAANGSCSKCLQSESEGLSDLERQAIMYEQEIDFLRVKLRESDEQIKESSLEYKLKMEDKEVVNSVLREKIEELKSKNERFESEARKPDFFSDNIGMNNSTSIKIGVRSETTARVEDSNKGDGNIKTRFKRNARGAISIVECDPHGKYVILENTSGVMENVSNCCICQVIESSIVRTFTLPEGSIINPRKRLTIYGRNAEGIHSPPTSIIMKDIPSWRTVVAGCPVDTYLYNPDGVEKASHNQARIAS